LTAIFVAVLNMSITASIVVLAVMLARIPLKKVPKVFSYALWGVVIFRLIFPFSFENIFNLVPATADIIPQGIISSHNPAAQFTPVTVIANNIMPINATGTTPAIATIQIAGYIWLFGFITLLGYGIMGYVNLKQRVSFATLVYDNIFESDRIKTPFVLGFICPKIYFPTTIDPSRHDYILKHEQIHIKRRDYLIKPFAHIVFALHWFNPLMWIAYFLMSKDMEMSCDEAVLKKTDKDIRRDYSTSLLNLSTRRVSLLHPVAFAIGEGNVKERIINVLHFKKSANWVAVVLVIVMGVFLVGFSFDNVLTIDIPPNINDAAGYNIHITNWNTDGRGVKIVDADEAREIGMTILNDYFYAFRYDWSNWEDIPFYLTVNPTMIDGNVDGHTSPWFGRVPERAGSGYFFTHPFMFYVDVETGKLLGASYFPPPEYIAACIQPFALGFDEALETHGDWWFEPLPFGLNAEYKDMLIEYSLELLNETGFSNSTVISTDIARTGGNFANGFVNITVSIGFANGEHAMFSFWVLEASFTLIALEIDF